MDRVLLGSDRHHLLAAAESDRANVLVAAAIDAQDFGLGGLQLINGVWDLEIHDFGRAMKALAVLARLEDVAVVGALALEYG